MSHIEKNNEVMLRNKDGFFQLEKDKEAVEEFQKEVNQKMMKFSNLREKIDYLVQNDYYYNVYEQYTFKQIKDIYDIAYSYNFKFQSYMAISKFYKDYALKTDDKKHYLEKYEDRSSIIALYFAQGNIEKAKKWIRTLMEQRYQPATPAELNAGKSRRGEMVSCFLLVMDDSLNSINYVLNSCGQLSKIGGGVAVDLSNLRGLGDPIKGVVNAAKGVVPVMKLMEDTFSYCDQMGQRKGSGAAYLNIFHIDAIRFLDTKKINADEKTRIKTLSIGLTIPNKFYELAAQNEMFYVFSPYSIQREYGLRMTEVDFDEMYDEFVSNPKVRKERLMNAREMLVKIAQTQFESGYPYINNITNANKVHPLKGIGKINMSNLCTEVYQFQEVSEINDYDEDDIIKRDINCTLGSLNMVNVMETKKFKETVFDAMEMLTTVSDMTNISTVPSIKKGFTELHAVGLGDMNLHGYLAKNKISYESKEARDFVRSYYAAKNFWSIEWSMFKAKESKKTFKDFDKSEYANGNFFDMYLKEDFSPKTDKVKKLFEGVTLPTIEDWIKLKEDVQTYGLYNAYRQCIAPTQSISYVQNSTSSVMPIVDIIETRTYGNAKTYYPMPFLNEENQFYYKSAYDIDMFKMIDLIAEIQRHVDQGISTILFVNSNTTTRELARYYIYAAKEGLKSLYYTRTKKLSPEECTSCAV